MGCCHEVIFIDSCSVRVGRFSRGAVGASWWHVWCDACKTGSGALLVIAMVFTLFTIVPLVMQVVLEH